MKKIQEFQGEYRFLSNFWPCKVVFEDNEYSSVECAYQAAKCKDPQNRRAFMKMSSLEAKRAGKDVVIRDDWEDVKVDIMYDLVKQKFTNNGELRKKLLETGTAELVEGNTWGDTFWGFDLRYGEGRNMLGKILMDIRETL